MVNLYRHFDNGVDATMERGTSRRYSRTAIERMKISRGRNVMQRQITLSELRAPGENTV